MFTYKYLSIESYWNNSNFYTNIISCIILKNFYFLLAKYLIFLVKEEKEITSDLQDYNDHEEK